MGQVLLESSSPWVLGLFPGRLSPEGVRVTLPMVSPHQTPGTKRSELVNLLIAANISAGGFLGFESHLGLQPSALQPSDTVEVGPPYQHGLFTPPVCDTSRLFPLFRER